MSCCGTAAYMAPEVLDGNRYGPKADVYSFGILMYEVVTGQRAFSEELSKKNFKFISFASQILNGERPKFTSPIKPNIQQLIKRCWSGDPKQRPTFRELFHKLSLSFEVDDETIESQLKEVISDQVKVNEDEEEPIEYSQHCLNNVDYDQLIDYVEEITTSQTATITNVEPINAQLQAKLDEQSKRISELEQQNQQAIQQLQRKMTKISLKLNHSKIN